MRPQLEYASTVWSPYTKKDNIHKVEMIQRRSIYWILNSYSTYDSVIAMQSQLSLRSLEHRRAYASVIMLYKIIHRLVAVTLMSTVSLDDFGSLVAFASQLIFVLHDNLIPSHDCLKPIWINKRCAKKLKASNCLRP